MIMTISLIHMASCLCTSGGDSGVTRGGRVAHPWKVGEILEGRGKGGKMEGRGKKGGKGKERQGK